MFALFLGASQHGGSDCLHVLAILLLVLEVLKIQDFRRSLLGLLGPVRGDHGGADRVLYVVFELLEGLRVLDGVCLRKFVQLL